MKKKLTLSISMTEKDWNNFCLFLSKSPFNSNITSHIEFQRAATIATQLTENENESISLAIDTEKLKNSDFLEVLAKLLVLFATKSSDDLTSLVN